MISVLARTNVYGDDYEEILSESINFLSKLFDIPDDEVQDRLNIEIEISDNEPLNNDATYYAIVTARLKNVR